MRAYLKIDQIVFLTAAGSAQDLATGATVMPSLDQREPDIDNIIREETLDITSSLEAADHAGAGVTVRHPVWLHPPQQQLVLTQARQHAHLVT